MKDFTTSAPDAFLDAFIEVSISATGRANYRIEDHLSSFIGNASLYWAYFENYQFLYSLGAGARVSLFRYFLG